MFSSETADGGKQRVLVVDDSEINRIITEAILASAGYQVDCVASGAAAIDILEERSYDLILMDMDMPDIDGCAATRAIRLGNASGTMVAALTSCTCPADRERAREAGMNAHFGRPIAPHDLIQEITALFAAPQADRAATIWQRAVYEHLVGRLGEARMRGFLSDLLVQCKALLDQITLNGSPLDDSIDRTAHDLASTSGMLGFQDLSDRCRDVLQAPSPNARTRAVRHLVVALTQAISALHTHLASPRAMAA